MLKPNETSEIEKFVARIQQKDPAIRLEAVLQATRVGAPAIAPLGRIIAGDDPGAAKAAGEALKRIAHHAARPDASVEKKAVAGELVRLITKDHPRATRLEALNLLGYVSGSEDVLAIAKQLTDRDVAEAARMALESIPDPAAASALQTALRTASDADRSGIQQSLRHKHAKWRDIGTAQ